MYMSVLLVKLLSRIQIVKAFVTQMGNISLESYLTNIYLNSLLIFLVPSYIHSPLFIGRYLEYALVILLGILMAYVYKILINKIY